MLKKTQSKFPKVLQEWLGHKKIEEIECVISDMAGVVFVDAGIREWQSWTI